MDKSLIIAKLAKDGKLGGADETAEVQDYINAIYEITGERIFPINKFLVENGYGEITEMSYEEYTSGIVYHGTAGFLSDQRFNTIVLPPSNPTAEVEVLTLNGDTIDIITAYETGERAGVCVFYTGTGSRFQAQPVNVHITFCAPK